MAKVGFHRNPACHQRVTSVGMLGSHNGESPVSFPQPSTGASRPPRTIWALVGDLARLLSGRRSAARTGEASGGPGAAAISPDYARLVNTLPDPILVVSGSDVEDVTGRRYIFANLAARELLRLDHDHGLLV